MDVTSDNSFQNVEIFCLPSLDDDELLIESSDGLHVKRSSESRSIIIIITALKLHDVTIIRNRFYEKYFKLRMSLRARSQVELETSNFKVIRLSVEIPKVIHFTLMRFMVWSEAGLVVEVPHPCSDSMVFTGERRQVTDAICDFYPKLDELTKVKVYCPFSISEFLLKCDITEIFIKFPMIGITWTSSDHSILLDGTKPQLVLARSMLCKIIDGLKILKVLSPSWLKMDITDYEPDKKVAGLTESFSIVEEHEEASRRINQENKRFAPSTGEDSSDVTKKFKNSTSNKVDEEHGPPTKRPSTFSKSLDRLAPHNLLGSQDFYSPLSPQLTPQLPTQSTPHSAEQSLGGHMIAKQLSFQTQSPTSSLILLTPSPTADLSSSSSSSSSTQQSPPTCIPPSRHQFNVVKIIQPLESMRMKSYNNFNSVNGVNNFNSVNNFNNVNSVNNFNSVNSFNSVNTMTYKIDQSHQQEDVRAEVKVNEKYHERLLGRKGFGLQKLSRTFGTCVHLEGPDVFVVTGRFDKVERTKKEIQRIVEEAATHVFLFFDVDHCFHSRMIGVRGKQVQRIMADFGVEIKFADRYSCNPHLVTIVGPPCKAEACKRFIEMNVQAFINEQATMKNPYILPVHHPALFTFDRNFKRL